MRTCLQFITLICEALAIRMTLEGICSNPQRQSRPKPSRPGIQIHLVRLSSIPTPLPIYLYQASQLLPKAQLNGIPHDISQAMTSSKQEKNLLRTGSNFKFAGVLQQELLTSADDWLCISTLRQRPFSQIQRHLRTSPTFSYPLVNQIYTGCSTSRISNASNISIFILVICLNVQTCIACIVCMYNHADLALTKHGKCLRIPQYASLKFVNNDARQMKLSAQSRIANVEFKSGHIVRSRTPTFQHK